MKTWKNAIGLVFDRERVSGDAGLSRAIAMPTAVARSRPALRLGAVPCVSMLAVAAASLLPAVAHAQDAAVKADATTAGPTDSTVAAIIVTGAANLTGVMQNKDSASAFGFDKPIVETPRSVTSISDKLLDRYQVKTVYDLTAVAAGTYTGSYFGVPGSANVRGTIADNYFNGFQMITNFATYPTPVDASSNIDLVRGPPSPAFGAGQIGGLLNFTPKSAYGDKTKYLTEFTGAGSLTYGSYDHKEATLEGGIPVDIAGNKGGLYAFAEITDSHDFYYRRRPKSQLGQLTFSTDLGEHWSFTVTGQYLHSSGFLKSNGWNRVTQDLIDHGTYQAGSALAQIATPGAAYITPAAFAAAAAKYGSPVQYVLPSYGYTATPNPLTELDPATAKTVHLSMRDTVISDDDINRVTTPLLYAGLTRTTDDGHGTFKIESYTQHLTALNYQSYGFATHFNTLVNEERISYKDKRDLGDHIHAETLVGGSFRYTHAVSKLYLLDGVDIQDRWDLSQPQTADSIFNAVFDLPGLGGYQWDSVVQSTQRALSPFLLEDATFFRHLDILAGVRADFYHLTAVDDGPLAAAGGYPQFKSVSSNTAPISYNVSVSYKNPIAVPYFTYAKSHSVNVDQADAVLPSLIASNSAIGNSELTEFGLKTSQLDGRFYAAIDAYRQKNTYLDSIARTTVSTRSEGIEGELRYLVTRSLGITGTATIQRVDYIGNKGGNGLFTFLTPEQAGTTGVLGYGAEFQSNTAYLGLGNKFELHTQPGFYGGLSATYDRRGKWGLTGGFTYNSSTGGFLPDSFKIHPYTLARAGVYLAAGGLRFDLTVSNLFNTRYFIIGYDTVANTTVLPGVGREFLFKVSKRF
jgi:iron complex outermembrane receptor protein